MVDATVLEIMDALATQLYSELGGGGTTDPLIENLQVVSRLWWNPTPPAIDVYPADPFQDAGSFGAGNRDLYFTVRARVDTPDNEAAQDLLLSMMDHRADTSVELAIRSDKTLGGTVNSAHVEAGPSDYGVFTDPGGNSFLGCTWQIRVIP